MTLSRTPIYIYFIIIIINLLYFIFFLFVRKGRPVEPLEDSLLQWHEASFYCLLFLYSFHLILKYYKFTRTEFSLYFYLAKTYIQFLSIYINNKYLIPTRDLHHLIWKPILKFNIICYIKISHMGCHLTSTSCINCFDKNMTDLFSHSHLSNHLIEIFNTIYDNMT